MATEKIKMDGRTYRVRIVNGTRQRAFEIISGGNAGVSLSRRKIRDIRGTSYTFTMQFAPDPAAVADYNLFYEAISAPVESHRITLPYGQTTITFDAAVISGTDTDLGVTGGFRRYGGLTVTFEPMEPQRAV